MIDVEQEQVIRLSRIPQLVNPSAPPHIGTIWRWTVTGVRGVKLECVQIGGQKFSSREAVRRFVARLNPGTVPELPSAAAKRAGENLAAKGA